MSEAGDNTQDAYGNLIVDFEDVGISTPVRYVKREEGFLFSEADLVEAVTGRKSRKVFRKLIKADEKIVRRLSPEWRVIELEGPEPKMTTLLTWKGVRRLIKALPCTPAFVIRERLRELVD